MRLIDADRFLIDENEVYNNTLKKTEGTENALINLAVHTKIDCLIRDTPTVDVVPVVHAHWNCIEIVVSYEGTFDAYECSHCHKSLLDDLCENNGSDYVNAKNDFKYCPFCGAKMDEKVEEKK